MVKKWVELRLNFLMILCQEPLKTSVSCVQGSQALDTKDQRYTELYLGS